MLTKKTVSVVIAALLALGLGGCVGGPGGNGNGANANQSEATETLDLTGEWEQSNHGEGGAQVATIVNDTITIYWAPNENEPKSLYWAGTVEVPEDAGGSFTWDSVADKSKTENALLASPADSKPFTYKDGIISYEVSALGVTWTVELTQTSATPSAAPAAEEASSSDFDVKIEGASFASDYAGKPAIVVSFAFTNNSDEAANFMFAVRAQAFQSGIELSDLAIVDGVDGSLSLADIQPGVTISVQEAFLLRDESPVTIEVREVFDFDKKIIATQEFSVS
jgi:hypothetical protein